MDRIRKPQRIAEKRIDRMDRIFGTKDTKTGKGIIDRINRMDRIKKKYGLYSG